MSMINRLMRFARTPQGQRLTRKAMSYASSPEGKRKIAAGREQLAKRGQRRPPR